MHMPFSREMVKHTMESTQQLKCQLGWQLKKPSCLKPSYRSRVVSHMKVSLNAHAWRYHILSGGNKRVIAHTVKFPAEAGQASQENPKWLENQGKEMGWGFLLWLGAGAGTPVNEEEEPMVSFSASPDRDKRQREKNDTAKMLPKARWWSWALLDLVSARANLRRTNCMYPFREHVERKGFI